MSPETANFIILVATCASAIATVVYVALTHNLVKEARNTRHEQTRPRVIASLVPKYTTPQLLIVNIGAGPALNVVGRWHFESDASIDTVTTWKTPALVPGTSEKFALLDKEAKVGHAVPSLNELGKRQKKLTVQMQWDDALGKRYTWQSEYGLSEVANGWYNSYWELPERSISERLEKLEDLEKHMRNISNRLDEANLKVLDES